MSIRVEGEVTPRFDYVVFDYLKLIGEAVAAKDDAAFLNLIETLENMLLPLAGAEERRVFAKLHEAEVTLKEEVIRLAKKRAAGTAHDSVVRQIERAQRDALSAIDAEFARLKLRCIGNVLRKIDVVTFKAGEPYKFEDVDLIARRLAVGLQALGFKVDKKKILEVLGDDKE